MAQWLKILAALLQELSLVSGINIAVHKGLLTPSFVDSIFSSGPMDLRLQLSMDIHEDKHPCT